MQKIYYHIYNRGAHKALVFNDANDYWRMLKLLYIANNIESFELKGFGERDIFSVKRKGTLVDIVAYCLMPNHFHIALKLPDVPDVSLPVKPEERHPEHPVAITLFMRKLCTSYSRYYNKKYDHSGTVWQGPFKVKNVFDSDYLKTLIPYIHLNPYKIKEPDMTKETRAEHRKEALKYSKSYEYSSLQDYSGETRQQTLILAREVRRQFIPDVSLPVVLSLSPNPYRQ